VEEARVLREAVHDPKPQAQELGTKDPKENPQSSAVEELLNVSSFEERAL
jgi:hypothetical protein